MKDYADKAYLRRPQNDNARAWKHLLWVAPTLYLILYLAML